MTHMHKCTATSFSRYRTRMTTDAPPEEPLRISAYTLYFQKLESLAYIVVAACMGQSAFKFVQWAPKDASFLHQSAFWPFKVFTVIQGR